jgi:predicted metal-dependent hydrolase
MDLYPSKVKLNRAEKRWGSCNYSTKTLNFTIRNAMLPDWVQEYIVIHELSHLVHPNHSAKFWSFVETFMPDYKQAEKYLRVNSSLLTL